MASITSESNGRRTIQFVGLDGKRRSLRLGKCSLRAAEAVKYRVEQLVECLALGRPMDLDLAAWVESRDVALRGKLERVGLIPRSEARDDGQLGPFLVGYFARRTDVKGSTRTNWAHTRRCLLAYFGPDRELSSITPGEARDWERWLRTGEAREARYAEREASEGLAPNTVRKRISNAKQFFADALERELIVKNPFAALVGSVGSNRQRDFFVTREQASLVLAACPDAEWRLLFALSRFGGLRCPSEHLALTWADVDWARSRITVHSPKTEHHEGRASRQVPLFPELRPHLEAIWDAAEPGAVCVVTRYRSTETNLRTQLQRIIRRAGLEPWPKLFQNLRATRATELAAEYPAHVAAAWLGHSTLVAAKHYWQTTDADFERAVTAKTGGAESGAVAVQNPVQQGIAATSRGSQETTQAPENQGLVLPVASGCDLLHNRSVGDTGLEHLPDSREKLQSTGQAVQNPVQLARETDAMLGLVVDVWPKLPTDAREAILRIVAQAARSANQSR